MGIEETLYHYNDSLCMQMASLLWERDLIMLYRNMVVTYKKIHKNEEVKECRRKVIEILT